MASNVLFSPIVDTYNTPFVETDCKVYFKFSEFNTIEDISAIQIMVRNPNTNESSLEYQFYPTEIKQVAKGSIGEDENGYYIILYNKDSNHLNDYDINFGYNVYYKAQLRFVRKDVNYDKGDYIENDLGNKDGSPSAAWLNSHTKDFSEWSTITLLRKIAKPSLKIEGLNPNDNNPLVLDNFLLRLNGSLEFSSDQETDTLKEVQMTLRDELNFVIEEIDTIFPDIFNPNHFSYLIKHLLQTQHYILEVWFRTNAGYSEKNEFVFYITEESQIDFPDFKDGFLITPDMENGLLNIKINMKFSDIQQLLPTPEQENNNFIDIFDTHLHIQIRRCSNLDEFQIWEIVHESQFDFGTGVEGTFEWSDPTVEAGVWYKYGFIFINDNEDTQKKWKTTKFFIPQKDGIEDLIAMVFFEDMFLTNRKGNLKVKLNPSLNSLKYTSVNTVINTLGSKYPFVRKNGNTNYRQFSIGGLISYWNDESHLFFDFDAKDYFEKNKEYVEQYNINQYNDILLEREYRNKVIEFLQEDNVKLLRTLTEGNILVKLTDLTLSPIETLGRSLYSFTATVVEIDECNLFNYNFYNILNTELQTGHYEFVITVIDKDEEIIKEEHYTGLDIAKELATINYKKNNLKETVAHVELPIDENRDEDTDTGVEDVNTGEMEGFNRIIFERLWFKDEED